MVSEVVSALAEDTEEAVRAAVAASLPAVAASFSSGLPEGAKDELRRSKLLTCCGDNSLPIAAHHAGK